MEDKDAPEKFEQALQESKDHVYKLRLFVTGMTPNSLRAIENIKRIGKEYLNNRFELEIIDIYQKPDLARKEHIIAAPTLIKQLPPPLRRLIGDLSDIDHTLVGLDLVAEKKEK
jgi:circadian clock protein KaiB